ncbi:MarR family transcriptional regulator [Flavobacterium sp.]|uniref:MarR family winged helix-turn-helix transcriptional regulator n=1 Tax=Flavobacterium sp. TaxID=239 RepID=UPI002603EC1A|nr:MarR family transcriptional regulator [Flavobacterium sp.]MDD2986901.1 MarR family transcriptional regulator [Flavobacterium sp.]
MKIEEIIKSNSAISHEKRTVLNIMFTQNVVADAFHDILKAFDLSVEQFNVLRILRGQKGKPTNMCMIQERMIAKTSNTTRLVDKLLLKGLVNRVVCEENRRKMEITITKKGLDLLSQLDPKIEAHETLFAQNLSEEELGILNNLLEKYRTL